MWRPRGWKTPNVYALRDCKPNQAVTSQDVRLITTKEQQAFEAGADAMLEALLTKGLKVNNIGDFPQGVGTVIFIPDEEEQDG